MKSIFYALAALLVVAGLHSCTDETIGNTITDISSQIIEDSSFTIVGHSVLNPRLQARTSTQLVGVIKSEGYGTLSSQVVTQFMPAMSIDTSDTSIDMIDSCMLKLRIAQDAFTGDSLAPMLMSVYRLNRQLPTPLFSDFDPTDYFDPNDLLGTAPYSPRSATRVYDSATGAYYLEVSVPMPLSLARELWTEYVTNPNTFRSPSAFAQFFPGVYIANTFGSGRVMNFTKTELAVYYRQKNIVNDRDTITTVMQNYMAATPEVLSNNIINLSIDQSVKGRVAAGEAIVMAPAGYDVELQFPIQDIIDSFRQKTGNGLSLINSLELEIPVENIATEYSIAPPKYLLMVKTSMKDKFIDGDSLANNKDSFYATYNAATRTYRFAGLRDYILNIIDNQGGVATAADINLTLLPIDVTTYTIPASYYQAAQTITTKIAPQVSFPAIAKLKLDKAKVKITYSRQMVM